MKSDKKTTRGTQVGARCRDNLAQGEVQDQSSMPQEDTGDWTLVSRMQPQAGLNLSGHQFLVVKKKKKKKRVLN